MRITSGGNMNHTEFLISSRRAMPRAGILTARKTVKREALRRLEQKLPPEGLEALTKTY